MKQTETQGIPFTAKWPAIGTFRKDSWLAWGTGLPKTCGEEDSPPSWGLLFSRVACMRTALVLMSPGKNSRHKCLAGPAWGCLAGAPSATSWLGCPCVLLPRSGCPLAPLTLPSTEVPSAVFWRDFKTPLKASGTQKSVSNVPWALATSWHTWSDGYEATCSVIGQRQRGPWHTDVSASEPPATWR